VVQMIYKRDQKQKKKFFIKKMIFFQNIFQKI